MQTFTFVQKTPVQMLKENAPSIFVKVAANQKMKINARLQDLRYLYKKENITTEEKQNILQEVAELKAKLKQYE